VDADEEYAEALLTSEARFVPHPSTLGPVHRMLGVPADVAPDEVVVAVSVTRAMKFKGGPLAFSHDDAERLLVKKLSRFLGARAGVHPAMGWSRAVLHVWSEHPHVSRVLEETLRDPARVPPRLWRTTIVLLTVAPAATMHRIIFKNAETFAEETDVPYDAARHGKEVARLRALESMRYF
jgi:hypothetical protein